MTGGDDRRFSLPTTAPLYVVGGAHAARRALAGTLAGDDSSRTVETAPTADAIAGPVAGVVCLVTSEPRSGRDRGRSDRGGHPTERTSESAVVTATGTALVDAAADADGPVVAVGTDGDAAALYEAGATDVVPLDPTERGDVVAERIDAIVDRAWRGRVTEDLFDAGADGVVVHDPTTGEVVACNHRFYEILGYDPEVDTVGLDDLTGHDSRFTRERAVERVRQAAAGESTTFEWRDPTADGSETWVEVALEATALGGERYVVATVRDIDERKRRERELADARGRFERVDDAFFAVDDDWRVTYANEAGAAVLRGAARDGSTAFVGESLWELVPDAVDTVFEREYRRAMRDQAAVTFEAPFEPMDRWFEVRAYPDETGLSVYFSDITDRKKREEELKRYETVLESLDDAVYAVEADGTIEYVNEKYATMKGVPREDLLGTNIYDWAGDEATERISAERERVEAGATDVGVVEYEFERVDGRAVPAEIRFAPIGSGNDDSGRVGVIRDVSDRKEREEELYIRERVLEEASTSLSLSDPTREDNPLVYVNEAFERLTGYDEDDVVGRNCRFLQDADTDPDTVAEIRAAVGAEETVSTTVRNRRKDGTAFWNHLDVTPICDEDGTLLRYLGTQRDVTRQRRDRRARRQLLSTTRALMDAESREEIARVVSDAASSILGHDLNVVYLRDEAGGLDAMAWSASVDETFDGPPSVDADGPVRTTLDRGEPVVFDRVDEGDVGEPGEYGSVESLLLLPLGDDGVLAAGATEPNAFDDAAVDRGELLTVNAATALGRMERREELEAYEALFETVQDKLYVLDDDGRLEMVSEPLAAAVGRDPESLRGQHLSTIVTEETVREGEALIRDLVVTPDRVSSTYEGTLVSEAGEETPVEVELSLLPYDDSFRGTVGAVRDISERRRRTRELRVVQQAITEAGIGLVIYRTDGTFTYVNEHYAELVGWAPAALESMSVWETFEGLSRETFEPYWESFSLGETRTTETEHCRADGSTVPVETVTTAVDIEGTRYRVATVREVTSRRERRQQSQVLHRVIRHNLRNELTVVRGHAQSLADELTGGAADRAETIVERADELADLTETAQDAEVVIGSDTVRQPVDLSEILRTAVSDLRAGYDCTVETDLPERQAVLGDDALRIAFQQVLANAVEHADTAVPHVSVTLAAADRPGWVSVEVADDGPGIPEHERSVLTAGEETSLKHGSGLGLWVVYWVVTRYGGELDFEARPTGGSLVRIDLPAATAVAEAEATTAGEVATNGETGVSDGTVAEGTATTEERDTSAERPGSVE